MPFGVEMSSLTAINFALFIDTNGFLLYNIKRMTVISALCINPGDFSGRYVTLTDKQEVKICFV